MFNSQIFKTEVHPYFNEEFQCSLRVVDDKTLKPVDFLDLKQLGHRECILVKALVETTMLREKTQLEKKLSLQKELKNRFKKLTMQDAEISMNLVIQIENKNKKLASLQDYKKLLENKISYYESENMGKRAN
jgi:hypothetical protein